MFTLRSKSVNRMSYMYKVVLKYIHVHFIGLLLIFSRWPSYQVLKINTVCKGETFTKFCKRVHGM